MQWLRWVGAGVLLVAGACVGEDALPPATNVDAGTGIVDASTTDDRAAPPGEPDARTPTWCDGRSPTPQFCSDFDGVPAVATGWDNDTPQAVGGSVSLEEVDGAPSPRFVAALRTNAVVDAGTSQLVARAGLVKTLIGTTETRAVASFAARLPSTLPGTASSVVHFVTVTRGASRGAGLYRRGDGSWYILAFDALGNSGALTVPSATVPLDRWVVVRFAIDTTTGTVQLTFDGAIAYNKNHSQLVAQTSDEPRYKLTLGLRQEFGDMPALDMRVDNVTFVVERP